MRYGKKNEEEITIGQRMPIGLQLTGLVGSVIALMIVLLAVVLYEFKSTSADYQHLLSVTVKNSITLLSASSVSVSPSHGMHESLQAASSSCAAKSASLANSTSPSRARVQHGTTRSATWQTNCLR